MDFEAKISRTKEILQQLGAQNLSLKESLSLYKQGMKELKEAQHILEKAKLEYEEVKLHSTEYSDDNDEEKHHLDSASPTESTSQP